MNKLRELIEADYVLSSFFISRVIISVTEPALVIGRSGTDVALITALLPFTWLDHISPQTLLAKPAHSPANSHLFIFLALCLAPLRTGHGQSG